MVSVHADREKIDSNGSTLGGLSPEALFFRTMASWQSSGSDWDVWKEFSNTLLEMFEKTRTPNNVQPESASPPSATSQKIHLEIVGAIEEGILEIERQVFEASSNAKSGDPMSDLALSDLYTAYGIVLSDLSAIECWKLATDPHTLLIGAPEKVQQYKNEFFKQPSPDDKVENAPSSAELLNSIFGPLCLDNAENAVRNAISLDARNAQANLLLERITGQDAAKVHERKPKEFVAELFDSFAESFDEKLVNQLEYRVPELIGKAVRGLPPVVAATKQNKNPAVFRAALDAGCGTGLAGRQLHPMVSGTLVGVDASSKMLEIASLCTRSAGCGLKVTANDVLNKTDTRPLYNSLLQMDLEDMTIANTLDTSDSTVNQVGKNFDLIVAADVLVYFGSLERIMEVFASLSSSSYLSRSSPSLSSWLVFTCERATNFEAPLGFRLLPSGRFSHTKEHAVNMASRVGFQLIQYQEIVPRMERGDPVKGHLFVFGRDADDHEEAGTSAEL